MAQDDLNRDELEQLVGEAAQATAKAMLRLNQNNTGTYLQCVAGCKDLFKDGSSALDECIKGCATVNSPKGDEVLAGWW